MKFIFVVLAVMLLFGCGKDGASSSNASDEQSSVQQQPTQDIEITLLPQLELAGDENFPDGTPARILAEITALSSDDVAYLTVEAPDNSHLIITPKNTLLYPTDGVASVALDISRDGVAVDRADIIVNLTTSEGLTVSRTHVISSEK